MGVMALAALWGFAEATLFFIVPDVLISAIAVRRGFSAALIAAVTASLGAVLGGALMYVWAYCDPQMANTVLLAIPGIAPDLISRVAIDFSADGWLSIFKGAFSGVPYKLYAAHAGQTDSGLAALVALTIPARLPRFVLTAAVASVAAGWLESVWAPSWVVGLLIAFWIVFYSAYFATMGF